MATEKNEYRQMTTGVFIVARDNLLVPDTAESRAKFKNYATNRYGLTALFKEGSKELEEIEKACFEDACDFFNDLSDQEVEAMVADRCINVREFNAAAQAHNAKLAATGSRSASPIALKPASWVGYVAIKMTSKSPPVVVDVDEKPITDGKLLYPGVLGAASVTIAPYAATSQQTSPGIAVWINGFVKVADGPRLPTGSTNLTDLMARVRAQTSQVDPRGARPRGVSRLSSGTVDSL